VRNRDASFMLLAAIVILTAGCRKPADTTQPPPGAVPASRPGGGAVAKRYRIAVVPKGTAHVFWRSVEKGARDAGDKLGAEILWNGPDQETDIEGQKRIIENYIAQGIDALVMAACHQDALLPTVKQASEAGIPTVTIDSGLSDPEASVCYVATDNVEGGRKAAEKLAELIGGTGEVGLIPFKQGAASSDERQRGFEEAMAEHDDIDIVATLYSESDSEIAQRVTENMLNAHPGLVGIFACNEPAGVAVARVVEERGLAGQVRVVAYDSSPSEVEALRNGAIQALIVQDPYRMGYDGVATAVKHLNGESVPERIDTGVTVVTAENMDDSDIQRVLYPLGTAD
jgi:ribose transport system substrate-binding protein